MADVLFGQAYYLKFDPKLWEAMQPYPPLGTLFAASDLRHRGFDVALFDAMLEQSEDGWAEALDRHQPKYAILFEDNFNYLSKMCLLRMREAAFTMLKMAKDRGITTIVCGADATDHTQRYMDKGADYVLLGEGEATLRELMDHLSGRTSLPLDAIKGLAFSDQTKGNGAPLVHIGTRRPVLKDLDALPSPAWDLVDFERYRKTWMERHGYYSINMVTTRGCPYHCNWCAKPIWGQRYNVRSPESVVEEMAELAKIARPDHIWFADDIMGLKPGWLRRFADLVEAKHLRIPFKALSRADLILRPGEVEALARAGAEIVWIGAESGSQKVLDAMDKGTKVEQIYDATKRLHDFGIRVAFFLQFGYPGESLEDIELTLKMVRECMPDEIGISVSYPLPGTKFYEAVKAQLGDKQNWIDSNDLDMMYEGPFNTEFYRKLHTIVHKEFQARQAMNELKRALPLGLRPKHMRRAAGMLKRWATLNNDRKDLMRLANAPHKGIGPLQGNMSHEEAAKPSPQG